MEGPGRGIDSSSRRRCLARSSGIRASRCSEVELTHSGVVEELLTRFRVGSFSRVQGAARQWGRVHASIGLTGVLGGLVATALTGGKSGLKIAYNQAKDEPGEVYRRLLCVWSWRTFRSSPRGDLRTTSQGADTIPQTISHASQPLGATLDVLDYLTNSGSYAKKSSLDKALLFTEQRFPASRAVSTWVALDGLGAKNVPLDNAKRAAFDWIQRKLPDEAKTGGAPHLHSIREQR